MYLRISPFLVALICLPCISGIYSPIGFHGTDVAAKDSMLKEIKTQKGINNQQSQIMGSGTYFGISPAIANEYAQKRCNERRIKPSKNAVVLILGVESKYAQLSDDLTKTPITAGDFTKYAKDFFDAVLTFSKSCQNEQQNNNMFQKIGRLVCPIKPANVPNLAKVCPTTELVVLDEPVVNNKGLVALGHYNVWEINAAQAPANTLTITQHKTKYYFYANPNLITKELTEQDIKDMVARFIKVAAEACNSDESWVFEKIADKPNTVLTETETETQFSLVNKKVGMVKHSLKRQHALNPALMEIHVAVARAANAREHTLIDTTLDHSRSLTMINPVQPFDAKASGMGIIKLKAGSILNIVTNMDVNSKQWIEQKSWRNTFFKMFDRASTTYCEKGNWVSTWKIVKDITLVVQNGDWPKVIHLFNDRKDYQPFFAHQIVQEQKFPLTWNGVSYKTEKELIVAQEKEATRMFAKAADACKQNPVKAKFRYLCDTRYPPSTSPMAYSSGLFWGTDAYDGFINVNEVILFAWPNDIQSKYYSKKSWYNVIATPLTSEPCPQK